MDSDIIVSFDIYTYKYNILLTYARIKDRSIDAEGYGDMPRLQEENTVRAGRIHKPGEAALGNAGVQRL